MRKKNTINRLSILLAFVLLSGGCKKAIEQPISEPDEPKPLVNFTIDPATQKDPFTFSFKGGVSNYKDLIWSFGDGATAFDMDLTHTYLTTGTFKVILKAQNKLGNWAYQEGKITIRPEDVVDFTAEPQIDGTLKLKPKMLAEVQDYSWYTGIEAIGQPIATIPLVSIPKITTSNFTYMTLKIKTPNGAEASYPKIVTNAGALTDITAKGVSLTVSNEADGGANAAEGSLKLVDGLNTTKFLIYSGYSSLFWAQQKTKTSVAVNAYTLVSGNDGKDRDPKSWDFLGSQDGITWVTLDSRNDIISDVRTETKVYLFNNTTNYSYYRINIKAIRGGTSMQLTEWRLMSTM
jgi:hypothetical protein